MLKEKEIMNFANAVKTNTNTKLTENGACAYTTQGNALTDLFAQVGALRPRTTQEIADKYAAAFAVDPLLATKMLFYAGNVRGGLGERRTFRVCLRWLAENHPSIVIKNAALIPHFNRWDSMFVLVGTAAEKEMWKIIADQLNSDMAAVAASKTASKPQPISLLAKWMPTETASSKDTRDLAFHTMRNLGLTPRAYRKVLSALRKHLKVVESTMSAREWEAIQYAQVPSYAMKNYRKAFAKHDPDGFSAYKASLVKGETKVNASTLFPYDLVNQYTRSRGYYGVRSLTPDTIIEAQWKALPNYVKGENNILVMADVSGSMSGRPMDTSIGLATYFAQRNKGDYHNLYMTFTDQPHFIELREGATLAECIAKVMATDVGYNTNLEKAFDYILKHAVNNGVSNDELPKALVVISDMEIDRYMRQNKMDFVDAMKTKFARFGYTLPKLILWNVEARNDTFLTKQEGVICVGGQSASTFRELCGNLDDKTTWDIMCETLGNKMYDCVTI
jgi:hypothetical protein